MAGWHHWLDGREFEWTPGVGDAQGRLACCSSWGRKKSDMTEQLNWTELKSISWWRRKWQAIPVFLPGESRGQRSLVGCCRGLHRVGHNWSDFACMPACIREVNGNPLQCSCLENPRDGGAWWAAIYGVAQLWTGLKRLSSKALILYPSPRPPKYTYCDYIWSITKQNNPK